MNQLSHHETSFEEKQFPVVLILDGVTSPANIGSLFRLADAFNIHKIILCGRAVDMGSNRLIRTARATVEKVFYEQQESTYHACEKYLEEGFTLLALEITKDSTPLGAFNFDGLSRIALVVGNERNGIHAEILQLAHSRLHIKMFGKNSSMNVAQATGIALYEITRSLPHI